jgi:NAD(P)-dependent dehydrogenase (short-subunit alcohol dehydrogenase family)
MSAATTTTTKVVLITGCSSGIGRSLAVLLAKSPNPSYRVYATMRNLSKQQPLVDAAGDTLNRNLFVHPLDVSSDASVASAVAAVVAAEGRVDVLVNNAGQGQSAPLEAVSMEAVQSTIDINFTGLVRVTRAVLPVMKKNGSGQVINISSIGGLNGVPFNDVYCAAKFAVEGFSESLAPVCKAFNIKINLIEPGPVATDFVANVMEADSFNEEARKQCDPKTVQIYDAYMKNMMANFKPEMAQSSQQVAEIIRDVIEAEQPPLRTQTHPNIRPGDMKFTDPSGDKALNFAFERYLKGTY